MVYTKHFVIHSFNKLDHACDYIKNADKTLVTDNHSDEHLSNLFEYIVNEDKTVMKQLVSGYGIMNPTNAYEEFKYTKLRNAYKQKNRYVLDKKEQRFIPPSLKELEKGNTVLAHHLIQSFSPDDSLTPEQIHEIGRKTMLDFTGGDYEFVIATHTDKNHIHNHIILNSTNLNTGKSFDWKLVKQKNGKTKDLAKERFEKVSDKIASQYGAKIIEKSPKNTHAKYTKWQTESLFKERIKSRLDFLLTHSSSIDDFKNKAYALNLQVDFSNKWATYKLTDEPQIKNTRGRSLLKSNPTKYNYEEIKNRVEKNSSTFSVEEVVDFYEEKVSRKENDFDYQLTIESWQISHKTERGYYLNIDYGYENKGKLFIGAYKVDNLDDGTFNIYVKKNDYFYFMSDESTDKNKYMTGHSLIKQLRLYNGYTPLKKEPIMRTIDDLVDAINFLASHDIEESNQLLQLESKLDQAFLEAKETISKLENKMIELNNLSKILLEQEENGDITETNKKIKELISDVTLYEFTFEEVQGEIEGISSSKNLLEKKIEVTRSEINKLHEIQAVQQNSEELQKSSRPQL